MDLGLEEKDVKEAISNAKFIREIVLKLAPEMTYQY